MVGLLSKMLATGGSFWLPEQATEMSRHVDASWAFVYWVSVAFFVLITFLLFYLTLRYKGKPGDTPEKSSDHNTPLEVFWSVVPTLIVVALFWSGFRTYLDLSTPPENVYEIKVHGVKWNWTFEYPNGYVDNQLHVPAERAVRLVMTSSDVIHSLYVPAFRIKRDVIPGRYYYMWFTATVPGEYDIFCAEYCGRDHSAMKTKLIVHNAPEFEAWLEEASDFLSRLPPAEAGELLYNQRGCKQCHSVDGSAGIAPTFKGLWGTQETLATGETVAVDENYVRESIYQPMAKLTAGFDPVMPTFQGRLKEEEIGAIIEYLKTLADDEAE